MTVTTKRRPGIEVSPAMDSELCRQVGKRIRARRNALGLSLAGLALRAGVSAAAVGSYERAERDLSLSVLERLAPALAVDPDVLLAVKPPCQVCGGMPLPGWTCNACGKAA